MAGKQIDSVAEKVTTGSPNLTSLNISQEILQVDLKNATYGSFSLSPMYGILTQLSNEIFLT